ncbi:MAG: glycoside hydrolase family 32 protein [Propioniciclava sp.]|uniref:GH32 C-terminal domain-containing protein n=1 Tax=Propioniciclava sp. TaxID=2038686 RepID=UPI0039E49E62
MPPANWLNDPNGLVFHKGRYHLFFQYNPYGNTHAHMSWGHASSTDLVTWQDHPVALWCTEEEQIYSGSAVVDHGNTSGLGTAADPALVAIYTAHRREPRHQAQSIAYSLDDGLTWTMYDGNPVADRGSTDFRDPKVFRWQGETGSYWVMLAVEAIDRQVVLYRSDDLLHWSYLSAFGPAGSVNGIWECPDLFPLQIDGTGETRWVLLVSLGPTGDPDVPGMQYFVGDFDGTTFTADEAGHRWLDHGPDYYAGVTFDNLPAEHRTLIAWMDNWVYARDAPLRNATRGAMTLARRLALASTPSGPRVTQLPVLPALDWAQAVASDRWAAPEPVEGDRVLQARLRLGADARAELRLRTAPDGSGGVVVTVTRDEILLDRTDAAGGVYPAWTNVHRVPRPRAGAEADLLVVLSEFSLEVFADGGTVSITSLILPQADHRSASLGAAAGDVAIESLRWGRPRAASVEKATAEKATAEKATAGAHAAP